MVMVMTYAVPKPLKKGVSVFVSCLKPILSLVIIFNLFIFSNYYSCDVSVSVSCFRCLVCFIGDEL